MRLSFLRLALLALACALLLSGQYAMGDAPKPSDTGNQPATTTPPATTKPPAPPTTPPTSSPPAPASTAPPPVPSTPAPSTATPNSSTPAPSSAPPTTAPANATTSAPEPSTQAVAPTSLPPPAPEATPAAVSNSTSDSDSSGMGAGAIIGIVLACVGLVAIVGFFAYRHFRARREDAENHEYDMQYGGASPVLESSRANDDKLYSMMELPKPSRQTTASTGTPSDDIVIMTKYATPSSPKFAQNAPQLSPPPFQQEVADFTQSVNNFGKSQYQQPQPQQHQQQQQPPATAASTEFATNSYRASYAESYAESYTGGGSFMNSYDQGGMMGRDTFRDTISSEQGENQPLPPAPSAAKTATLDSAALEANNNQSHWMDAMDEMRDTQDSYAMLEAGGSFGSRGSAMRFSNESDLRG